MKQYIALLCCGLPALATAQTTITNNTYHKPQGSYVAPVTTKTYTYPAAPARTYTPPPKSSSPSYAPATPYRSGSTADYNSGTNEPRSSTVSKKQRLDGSPIVRVSPLDKGRTLYLARRYNSVLENNYYGFVDEANSVAVPFSYDDARDFCEGRAAVQKGSKWGFIDSTGAVVVPVIFTFVGDFKDGFASAIQNRKMGLISEFGTRIIHDKYDYVAPPTDGYCLTQIDGKWGFMDLVQKIKVPMIYEEAHAFNNGLARVKLNGKWGFVDLKAQVVVPIIYEGLCNYSEDLAAAYLDGKCGFIDRDGKTVVPFEFGVNSICPGFYNGYAMVLKKGKYGWVDKAGTFSKKLPEARKH